MTQASIASISFNQPNQIDCHGHWTLSGIRKENLNKAFTKIVEMNKPILIFNTYSITQMDSSGAWQLYQWKKGLVYRGVKTEVIGLSSKYALLIKMVEQAAEQIKPLPRSKKFKGLALIGEKTCETFKEGKAFLYFIGTISHIAFSIFRNPNHHGGRETTRIIENTGFNALGIIALLAFMIGIVLTYQMGFHLKNVGAALFIIDLLGLAILREFAPLLTAIMVAGRSGSSFTAELGLMKIKEEVDALATMGISPNQLLIVPRILGLLIALPLLTVWADIFGLLGGMMMTHSMLHISYSDFLQRFPEVVSLSSLLIGVGKAPVFALIISTIACFQGLRVGGSADSVGKKTTRSVVQGIFFIIVADALFSILFSWLNI